MLGGADNPNGELLSYIIGADMAHKENYPDYEGHLFIGNKTILLN